MTAKRVVICGSSGLIGTALVQSFVEDDIQVTRLVRRAARNENERSWQPEHRQLDPSILAEADAVVNLSGASIARVPWTRSYRNVLVESRIKTTTTLAEAVAALGNDAPLLVSASAVGYYGHRPGELLTEHSAAGDTFLARLCQRWEIAALSAGSEAHVALLRTAPVLHRQGILKPLIPLTRMCLAGPLGGGRQMWPWISLDDEIRAIRHIIDQRMVGPVNLTGPAPATANEIGHELASQMRRPFVLPAPRWALRLGLGRDVADSLLLADANVVPERLFESGFTFTHTTITQAISAALGS